MNNNNKNKRPLTSFAKSVLTEMIRLLPVQVDIWRLEKEIGTLKSQNLELTSRLAAVESGMAPMALLRTPVRFNIEDWKGCDPKAPGVYADVELPGDDAARDAMKLRRAIGVTARHLMNKEPGSAHVVHVRSRQTGLLYNVRYVQDELPEMRISVERSGKAGPEAATKVPGMFILQTDAAQPDGYKGYDFTPDTDKDEPIREKTAKKDPAANNNIQKDAVPWFRIDDFYKQDYVHKDTSAHIDALDGPDEENEKTLNDTIRTVAEKIAYERPGTKPTVRVGSTRTGIRYAVDYSKDVFPSALVRIYYPNGTVENGDVQDAAKFILCAEAVHACDKAPETRTKPEGLPPASLKFEITDHTMRRTLRKVELEGKDSVADARNLNDAIRRTADSIMEPGEDATTIGVVSLQTGMSFIVPYEEQAFPRASVSIMRPDGNTDVMRGTVDSTGRFIIDTDASHPAGYKGYMAAPDADVKPAEEPKKKRGIGPSEVFLSFYQRDMGLIGRHALAGNSITEDAAELNDKIEKFAKDVTDDTCVPVKLVIESRETKVTYEVTYRKEKFPHADICIIDPRHYGTRTESTFNAGRCILHLDGKCKGGHTYASEPGMEADKPKLAFRIHDAEYRHIGQVNLNGRIFVIDMEELSTAIRRAADLLKRQFKDPSRLRLVSDTTGRGYDVVYDEARWPYAPSVTLVTGAGSNDEKRYTFHEVQNTAAWIIEHDVKPDTKWADDEQRKKF